MGKLSWATYALHLLIGLPSACTISLGPTVDGKSEQDTFLVLIGRKLVS